MKVKTFTGTHRVAVDKQVNDWLAQTNVPSARPTLLLALCAVRGAPQDHV
jgi:hypothetical protein